MPVPDISAATETLQNLLELNVARLAGNPVTVETLRPEGVASASSVLNLYCYHVTEDPHTKLRPRQPRGQAIATSPLSLVLHYIVTAHIGTGGTFDALAEQRLLSFAMKTFHDFPIVEDGTSVGVDEVLPIDIRGRNNRFEISMVQMNPQEALDFWANEDSTTAKPSAYYEVRPVEVEPEEPTRVPGVVLTLGNFVYPIGTPQIAATESVVFFELPTDLGGGMGDATVSPAKIGPENPVPGDDWNILRLRGTSLNRGQRQTLYLTHPHWSLLFPDLTRIPVDMDQNAILNWSQALTDGGVQITVGEELDVPRPDGTFTRVALYPGSYTASWGVELLFERPDGTHVIEERSNSVPFTINPRITAISREGGTGNVTLTFGGAWDLDRGVPPPADPVADPELDILLSIDGTTYPRWVPPDPPTPQPAGTYTFGPSNLTYIPLAAADQPGLHTIRAVINGTDTQPFWLEIP